jgi:hypothetical protein
MLIGKTKEEVKVGDVASLRLMTGEEIIGKVVATDGYSITITKPIAVQVRMVGQGQAAIAFDPFMVSVEEEGEFTFAQTALSLQPKKARADIQANYLKATTGLDVPPPQGILRA